MQHSDERKIIGGFTVPQPLGSSPVLRSHIDGASSDTGVVGRTRVPPGRGQVMSLRTAGVPGHHPGVPLGMPCLDNGTSRSDIRSTCERVGKHQVFESQRAALGHTQSPEAAPHVDATRHDVLACPGFWRETWQANWSAHCRNGRPRRSCAAPAVLGTFTKPPRVNRSVPFGPNKMADGPGPPCMHDLPLMRSGEPADGMLAGAFTGSALTAS